MFRPFAGSAFHRLLILFIVLLALEACQEKDSKKIFLCDSKGNIHPDKFLNLPLGALVLDDAIIPLDYSCSTPTIFCAKDGESIYRFNRAGKGKKIIFGGSNIVRMKWTVDYEARNLSIAVGKGKEVFTTCRNNNLIFH